MFSRNASRHFYQRDSTHTGIRWGNGSTNGNNSRIADGTGSKYIFLVHVRTYYILTQSVLCGFVGRIVRKFERVRYLLRKTGIKRVIDHELDAFVF